MNDLLVEFQLKMDRISLDIQRYLIDQLDLNNQLIAIKGAVEIEFGNIIPVWLFGFMY